MEGCSPGAGVGADDPGRAAGIKVPPDRPGGQPLPAGRACAAGHGCHATTISILVRGAARRGCVMPARRGVSRSCDGFLRGRSGRSEVPRRSGTSVERLVGYPNALEACGSLKSRHAIRHPPRFCGLASVAVGYRSRWRESVLAWPAVRARTADVSDRRRRSHPAAPAADPGPAGKPPGETRAREPIPERNSQGLGQTASLQTTCTR